MIRLENINIKFSNDIIKNGTFFAKNNEVTCLIGESGSGKSSLLNILSLYAYEKNFDYFLGNINLKNIADDKLKLLMKSKIAYLRQEGIFLNTLCCKDNIKTVCAVAGKSITDKEINRILEKVLLENKMEAYPSSLSGGEKQRLAIAMAIAQNADIVLCDEITSALDDENTLQVMALLKKMAHEENKTVIVATHEGQVVSHCDTVFQIKDQSIILVREANHLEEAASPVIMREYKMRPSLYFSLASARLRKKKAAFFGTVLLSAAAISCLVFASGIMSQAKQTWSSLITRTTTNELAATNNTLQSFHGFYSDINALFSKEDVDKIENITHIDAIYPFYGAMLNRNEAVSPIEIKTALDVQTSYHIKPLDESISAYKEMVFPYYEKQRLEEICEQKNGTYSGAYLSYHMARALGVSEITKDMKLTCDLYVPVSVTDTVYRTEIQRTPDEAPIDLGELPGIERNYEKVKLEIPLSGILPASYSDVGLGSGLYIFIPYETMNELVKAGMEKHLYMNENEYISGCSSTYKIFVDAYQEIQNVKNDLMNVCASMTVMDSYAQLDAIQTSEKDSYQFMFISILSLFVINCVLVFVYGIFHKKDAEMDYFFYHIHGLTNKEKKKITLTETFMIFVCVAAFSIILTNFFVLHGVGYYQLLNNGIVSFSYSTLLLLCLLLSLLVTAVSESVLFLKG